MDECPLYADPELYDSLFPGEDEARRQRTIASERFYLEEAKKSHGRVLELACGSGRLTIPIAQQGVEIIGADLSRPMLDAARAKASRAGVDVPFVEADMRNFDLPGKFAGILIPGNSLLHLLSIDDLKQCFASVRRHLAPRGRLVFDISKWDSTPLTRELKVNGITIEETATYDAAEQVRHVTWAFPDSRKIEYRLRVIYPQELLLLLDAAGFRLEARYGEFPREPFDSSSPRQVCICSASVP